MNDLIVESVVTYHHGILTIIVVESVSRLVHVLESL